MINWIYWYIRSYFPNFPYDRYLQSKAWKLKRSIVRWWASSRCMVCYTNTSILDTHHRTYIRLGRERLTDLICLCRKHHSMFHGRHHEE